MSPLSNIIEEAKAEWEKSKVSQRIMATEMFAINHGFEEWHEATIPDWWLEKLSSAFNEGVKEGEGKKGETKRMWYMKGADDERERIISELESNPNEDGSISPSIPHWIERKKNQLRKLSLIKEEDK